MVNRLLNILKTNSFFLFGPRGVGKTHYLRAFLPAESTYNIDLLDPDVYERFASDPTLITRIIKPQHDWVVIDEVQKIPALLDIVHQTIESGNPQLRRIKFALSGSSARKLKRGGANLLAGRAYTYQLYPLTAKELTGEFSLESALTWGTLPKSHFSKSEEEKKLFLQSYTQTYLKEEIQVEQIVRNIDPFRRFLTIAAQSNGDIINYSNIAKDVLCSSVTVQSYFQILEDTLLGSFLEPFHNSIRKRQRTNPKFYFFDCGVVRALNKQLTVPVTPATFEYGNLFETFIVNELRSRSSYNRNDFSFSYLRTKDDAEIDLVIERPGRRTALVEIKSKSKVHTQDAASLNSFLGSIKGAQGYLLSCDPIAQKIGSAECLPWGDGIDAILHG